AYQPKLERVSIGPNHYTSTSPSITGEFPVESETDDGIGPIASVSLGADAFIEETPGPGGCDGGITYNIGFSTTDEAAATWFWWNSAIPPGSWQTTDGITPAESSSQAALEANKATLVMPAAPGQKMF